MEYAHAEEIKYRYQAVGCFNAMQKMNCLGVILYCCFFFNECTHAERERERERSVIGHLQAPLIVLIKCK